MQDQEWFALRNSRIQGPFSQAQVQRYFLLGRIRASDRVSNDGTTWRSLESYPELIPHALMRIKTEEGWLEYLAVREQIDERAVENRRETGSKGERRQSNDARNLDEFRREWLALLGQLDTSAKGEHQSRVLPLCLLLITVMVIAILLWLIER